MLLADFDFARVFVVKNRAECHRSNELGGNFGFLHSIFTVFYTENSCLKLYIVHGDNFAGPWRGNKNFAAFL